MNQRLNQEQAQQLSSDTQVQTKHRAFEEAEEVIRADRDQTVVPPSLANKLANSIAAEPAPTKRWWRRIFG